MYILFIMGKVNKLLFVLCVSLNLFANDRIVIATGEYPPYLSEELEHNGVGLRIISEAFRLAGVDVEYRFYPWKRSFEYAQSGICDATATWTWNEERDELFLFSDPLYIMNDVFFHKKTLDFNWEDIDDLAGYSIGATEGYSYTEEFLSRAQSGSIDVEFEINDILNMRKLMLDRIDLFPINIDVGYEILAKEFGTRGIEMITYNEKHLRVVPTYLLFSRNYEKHIEMAQRFNKGLKMLKDEGRIDEYFKQSRYGLNR